MGIHHEIKDQQQKLKDMTFRQKWDYYWYYYKIHTFAAIFIIVCLSVFIRDLVTAKDYAFYGIMLNSYAFDASGDEIGAGFGNYAGIDLNEYECYLDFNSAININSMSQMDMAVTQKIMAMTQSRAIDVMVSDAEPFENYATSMMFHDLRTVLSAEDQAKYQDRFYYIDGAAEPVEDDAAYNLENTKPAIDHKNPAAMKDPIPVGIFVEDAPKFKEWGAYLNGSAIFGIVASTQFPETSIQYLEYLYAE